MHTPFKSMRSLLFPLLVSRILQSPVATAAACQICTEKMIRSYLPISLQTQHFPKFDSNVDANPYSLNSDRPLDLRQKTTSSNVLPKFRELRNQRHNHAPLYMTILNNGGNIDNRSNGNNETHFPNDDQNVQKESTFDATAFFDELKHFTDNQTDMSNITENKIDDDMSIIMIATIGFYKKVISPLLPPACRFVPTCSTYGVQAIEQFGPTKGCILIAWRLLRCSPFGGKGYDPPKWPPVTYTYSSY